MGVPCREMGKRLDGALAVLNGAIGNYLARTNNALATEMAFIDRGAPLTIDRAELARALPDASPRVVVLVHGLMCTETIWEIEGGGDYGALLARDLGSTPLYLRYNSGLAIADNGEALSRLLEALVAAYPVAIEQIDFIGFSMGGLVVRSACHAASVANHGWLARVRRAFYLGTPHLGAPSERVGRVVAKVLGAVPDPYTRLVADLANLRSDGVQDLGDADLRHEDRARRVARIALRDPSHPVPLLPPIRHYLVASTLYADPWLAALFGDSVVPVRSATDGARLDVEAALRPSNIQVLRGIVHLDLPRRLEVYDRIRAWYADEVSP